MGETVTVNTAVKYRRWQVPNHAVHHVPARPRQEGLQMAPTTPVADLPLAVVNALAQAWLDELYAKARFDAPQIATLRKASPEGEKGL